MRHYLGMTLHQYMTAKRLSQKDLAALIGVDPSRVCRWLRGQVPGLAMMAKIECATSKKVRARDFLKGDEG